MILPEAWRGEVCKGSDAAAIAGEMVKRGLIVAGGDMATKLVKVPNNGATRLYVLATSILGAVTTVTSVTEPRNTSSTNGLGEGQEVTEDGLSAVTSVTEQTAIDREVTTVTTEEESTVTEFRRQNQVGNQGNQGNHQNGATAKNLPGAGANLSGGELNNDWKGVL